MFGSPPSTDHETQQRFGAQQRCATATAKNASNTEIPALIKSNKRIPMALTASWTKQPNVVKNHSSQHQLHNKIKQIFTLLLYQQWWQAAGLGLRLCHWWRSWNDIIFLPSSTPCRWPSPAQSRQCCSHTVRTLLCNHTLWLWLVFYCIRLN